MSVNINEIIVSVLGLALNWVVFQISQYIKVKNQTLQQKVTNDKYDKYIDIASTAIEDVVQGLNQSIVNDLKKASADGKLTDDEKKEILQNAIEISLNTLSPKVQTTLEELYGDLPSWIRNKVETIVASKKQAG